MGTTDKIVTGGAVGASVEVGRRARWAVRLSERQDIVYALLAIAAVIVVVIGQVTEDRFDSPGLQMLPPTFDLGRWAVIGLTIYIFAASGVLARTARRALASLRSVIKLDTDDYSWYETRLQRPSPTVDVVLFLASVAVVIGLFLVIGSELPVGDPRSPTAPYLPSDPLAALIVLAGYAVFGWAGLRLVYTAIRYGGVLQRLAREPMEINVFDTSNLEPFGNVALAVALAPAGIIIILLVGLGTPSTLLGWTVLLLASVSSVLALLLPLLGIHRRMSEAKDAAMGELGVRLAAVYAEVDRSDLADPAALARVRDTANTLVPIRKTVQEMPAWPFRNTAAFGRAVLVASAPLIYATLNELIRIFWLQPLTR